MKIIIGQKAAQARKGTVWVVKDELDNDMLIRSHIAKVERALFACLVLMY
jgi:hypothetical protein